MYYEESFGENIILKAYAQTTKTKQLSNPIDQSQYLEPNRVLTNQKISSILVQLNTHYRSYKTPPRFLS
jgi:hypothetical protein